MKYPHEDRKIIGTALPLSALRSGNNCGCGEFTDLVPFARYCKSVGLSLIQLLPVNDTGSFSSPYSALSSVALNPVYLNLPDALGPEGEEAQQKLRATEADKKRFNYEFLYRQKEEILRAYFKKYQPVLSSDPQVLAWEKDNPWICAYAVYKTLKMKENERHFQQWPVEYRVPSPSFIKEYYASQRAFALFYVWVQFLCDRQFAQASATVTAMGLALKGDLPILMNEDSADVWASPELFDTSMSAGAPPDMFSVSGQNWGFPVYVWDKHRATGFEWWKTRLSMAQKYYHAFRIDHVLGFFRIWSILPGASSGDLGFYNPSIPIRLEDLEKSGFTKERIRWLTLPHIPGAEIRETFEENYPEICSTYFDRIGEEDLYWFKKDWAFEKKLAGSHQWTEAQWSALGRWLKDRTFIERDEGLYPYWHYKNSKAYLSLSSEEKRSIDLLVHEAGEESEALWEVQGRDLLSFMQHSTDMLICAEDLGAVPKCVPRVLSSLFILGLKIVRWTRDWEQPEAPFIPCVKYPALSVATASVHDTTTLRGWWDEEAEEPEKIAFLTGLGLAPELAAQKYSPSLAATLLSVLTDAGSRLLVLQFQDFLALDPEWGADRDDRINIPGTVSDTNWTYLLPIPLEKLPQSVTMEKGIKKIAARRP